MDILNKSSHGSTITTTSQMKVTLAFFHFTKELKFWNIFRFYVVEETYPGHSYDQ